MLSEQRTEQYDAIYGAYRDDMQRMITDDGFKLILYPKVPKALLFDLAADPEEREDLSELGSHKPRIKTLFGKLRGLQTQTGDELDLATAFPNF